MPLWGASLTPGSLAGIMQSPTGQAPICLLDVVRTNGDSFHWANAPCTFTPMMTGNTPAWASMLISPPPVWDNYYWPWLLSSDEFHFYRSTQADSATFIVQNLSGNTLQRDTTTLLRAATFEGAKFFFRCFYPQALQSAFGLAGRLTLTGLGETQCQFGTTPLVDEGNYDGTPYDYSETCQWNYGEPGCGDTTANPCANSYTTCRQTGRFLGVLNTYQINVANGDTLADISTTAVIRTRMA